MSSKKSNSKKGKDKPKKSLGRLKIGKEVKSIQPNDHEWYNAKFDDAELKEGQYGDYLQLKFVLTDGELEDGSDANGKFQYAFADAKIPYGSPSYEIVTAIIGKELDEDDDLDLEAYYGQKVQVFIVVEEDKDNTRSKITKIRPIKKNKKKTEKVKSKSKKKKTKKVK